MTQTFLQHAVRHVADGLTDEELQGLNEAMQRQEDPRPVAGFDKANFLFTHEEGEFPIADHRVAREFAQLVRERTLG